MDIGRYYIDKDRMNTYLPIHKQREMNENIEGGGFKINPNFGSVIGGKEKLIVKTPSKVGEKVKHGVNYAYDSGSWLDRLFINLLGIKK